MARDEEGKPYTVRYEAVNAMLLNEFLKEHRKVEAQAHANKEQEYDYCTTKIRGDSATISQVLNNKRKLRPNAALKAQAAQIQKVSDQLRAQAPRVVADD